MVSNAQAAILVKFCLAGRNSHKISSRKMYLLIFVCKWNKLLAFSFTSGSCWKMTTRPPLSPVARSSPEWLNSTVDMMSAANRKTQSGYHQVLCLHLPRKQEVHCVKCSSFKHANTFLLVWKMLNYCNFISKKKQLLRYETFCIIGVERGQRREHF